MTEEQKSLGRVACEAFVGEDPCYPGWEHNPYQLGWGRAAQAVVDAWKARYDYTVDSPAPAKPERKSKRLFGTELMALHNRVVDLERKVRELGR